MINPDSVHSFTRYARLTAHSIIFLKGLYFTIMLVNNLFLVVLLGIAALASFLTGKLNAMGALAGFLLGLLVFAGAGYTGLAMMAAFFLLGTLATSFKSGYKQRVQVAEKSEETRTAGQVLANAGVAGILGLLIWIFPAKAVLFRLMMASSLASATADTLSSEMGNVYGKRFYNILSFQKDQRGLNGVISAEGTLFGLAGSIFIALIYGWGFGWSLHILWIILAGTIGNLSDSVLGAALERRHLIGNDSVNFLNTLIAAMAGWLLAACF